MRRRPPVLLTLVVLLLPACAARSRAPVLLGEAAVAVAESIGELQRTTKALTDAGVLPLQAARDTQARLLQVNDRVDKAVPILEALNRAVEAGQDPSQAEVAQVLKILGQASADLAVVLTGVPLTPETQKMVDRVQTAQDAISNALVEVGRVTPEGGS